MVQGFKIQEDGTRVPCKYDSHTERAWCECDYLHKAGLYEEAYKKLDEYHDLNGGFINKSDWGFILKIEMGYLKVKPTEQNFENAKHAWSSAAFDALDSDEMAEFAEDMADIFIKAHDLPIEYDDYSNATPEQIIKALEFILSVIKMGNDQFSVDLEVTDFLHRYSMGMRELRDKGCEAEAQELFDEVKKLHSYKRFFEKNDPFKDEDDEE